MKRTWNGFIVSGVIILIIALIFKIALIWLVRSNFPTCSFGFDSSVSDALECVQGLNASKYKLYHLLDDLFLPSLVIGAILLIIGIWGSEFTKAEEEDEFDGEGVW